MSSVEIKTRAEVEEKDHPMVRKIAEYSGRAPDEVVKLLRGASMEFMPLNELRSWLDSVALAVTDYISKKHGIPEKEVDIKVTVDSDGKWNVLEPRVNVGDYDIVLKKLSWTAKWGDMLGEGDSVEELAKWGDEIAEEYKKIKEKFKATEMSHNT